MRKYTQTKPLDNNLSNLEQKAIEGRDPRSLYLLGWQLGFVDHETPNYEKAAVYFRESINGDPESIDARLALAYLLFDKKVKKHPTFKSLDDEIEALSLAVYRLAIEKRDFKKFGHVCYLLGLFYDRSSADKAKNYFKQGSEAGDYESLNVYGCKLICQQQTKQEGRQYLERAARTGKNYLAYYNLAAFMECKAIEGSDEEIYNLYLEAAKLGFAKAQYVLGHLLTEKVEKESENKKASLYQEAADWYYKAALQGHAEAASNYALLLDEGHAKQSKGDSHDIAYWYKKAIEQGVLEAYYDYCIHLIYQDKIQAAKALFEEFKLKARGNSLFADVIKMLEQDLYTKSKIQLSSQDLSLTTPTTQRSRESCPCTPRSTPRKKPFTADSVEIYIDRPSMGIPKELEDSFIASPASISCTPVSVQVSHHEVNLLDLKTPKVSPLDVEILNKSARLKRELGREDPIRISPLDQHSQYIVPPKLSPIVVEEGKRQPASCNQKVNRYPARKNEREKGKAKRIREVTEEVSHIALQSRDLRQDEVLPPDVKTESFLCEDERTQVVPFEHRSQQPAPPNSQRPADPKSGITVVEKMVVYPHDPAMDEKLQQINRVEEQVSALTKTLDIFMQQQAVVQTSQQKDRPPVNLVDARPVSPGVKTGSISRDVAQKHFLSPPKLTTTTSQTTTKPKARLPDVVEKPTDESRHVGDQRRRDPLDGDHRRIREKLSQQPLLPIVSASNTVRSKPSVNPGKSMKQLGDIKYPSITDQKEQLLREHQQEKKQPLSEYRQPPLGQFSHKPVIKSAQSLFVKTEIQKPSLELKPETSLRRLFAEFRIQIAFNDGCFRARTTTNVPLKISSDIQRKLLQNSIHEDKPFAQSLAMIVTTIGQQLPQQITAFHDNTHTVLNNLVAQVMKSFQEATDAQLYKQRKRYIPFFNASESFHGAFRFDGDCLSRALLDFLHSVGSGCFKYGGTQESISDIPINFYDPLFQLLETLIAQTVILIDRRKKLIQLLSHLDKGMKSCVSLSHSMRVITDVVDQCGVNQIGVLSIENRPVEQSISQEVARIQGISSALNSRDKHKRQSPNMRRWTLAELRKEMNFVSPPSFSKCNLFEIIDSTIFGEKYGFIHDGLLSSEGRILGHMIEVLRYYEIFCTQTVHAKYSNKSFVISGNDSQQLLLGVMEYCKNLSNEKQEIPKADHPLSAVHDVTLIIRYIILMNIELVDQYYHLLWLISQRSDELMTTCKTTKERFEAFFERCSVSQASFMEYTQYPLSELDYRSNRPGRGLKKT